jgi:hypothetical protein
MKAMVGVALLVYCFWSVLLILQGPGVQYDEALLVLGSVQMRHSPLEIGLPHDPDTWFCLRGRCLPLMTVRYVGAIKEYLCLPLFAIFGASAEAIRVMSMLLGALGIWGLARLVSSQIGATQAAVVALVLAINPAYLSTTIFDNGTVAIWMGAFGLLCLAMAGYLEQGTAGGAFWLGFTMGLGIWARANFVWLLGAIFVAAVVVLRSRLPRVALSHWAALVAGGVVGGLPFLAYQIHSRFGTWEAVGIFSTEGSVVERIYNRLVLFAETLLTDREHRAMWNGPPMDDWQRWLFLSIVAAACVVCLAVGRRTPWAQAVTITFLILSTILFTTRLPVSEHHLIVLIPLAAAVVTAALSIVRWRWLSVAVAVIYASTALYWQISAIHGLRTTGGVGIWSDSMYTLADYLEEKYPDQEVKILDWGLQDNLFVLTDGRLHSREIFGDPHPRWMDEIRAGGVFVMNGPDHRQFPAASEEFLKALKISQAPVRRFVVRQESGAIYSEIFEVPETPR